jgi:hypothetical protein
MPTARTAPSRAAAPRRARRRGSTGSPAPRARTRSAKPVRWKRSSSTSTPPETSDPSTATTSALTWNSGSGLSPRSSAVSPWCAATARATWSNWSSRRRTALRGPVEPELKSRTPPCAALREPSSGGGASSAPSRWTGRPRSPAAGEVDTTAEAPARSRSSRCAGAGAAGSSGTTVAPAATSATKRVARSSGSAASRPTARPPTGASCHAAATAAASARETVRSERAASSQPASGRAPPARSTPASSGWSCDTRPPVVPRMFSGCPRSQPDRNPLWDGCPLFDGYPGSGTARADHRRASRPPAPWFSAYLPRHTHWSCG